MNKARNSMWVVVCAVVFSIAASQAQAATVMQTSTPNVSIPDRPAGGAATPVSDTLTIPVVAGTITDVNLRVGIDHLSVGDLIIELLGPSSTMATLLDQPGTTGTSGGHIAALISTVPILFNDQAPSGVLAEDMGAPPTSIVGQATSPNNYIPSPDLLAAFNGEMATGDWTIRITDNVNGLSGVLVSWELAITTLAPNPVPLPAAAWMAMPLLAVFGVVQLVRRRQLAA